MADPIPLFRAGETLPASKLQQLGNHGTAWTPTLEASTTNPTLGTGSAVSSLVWLNGQHVTLWFRILFGTTGAAAGSGTYSIPFPAGYPAMASHPEVELGVMRLFDSSASAHRLAVATLLLSGQEFTFRTTSDSAAVTNAAPWVWAASDVITGQVSYLTDF